MTGYVRNASHMSHGAMTWAGLPRRKTSSSLVVGLADGFNWDGFGHLVGQGSLLFVAMIKTMRCVAEDDIC